jgi:hypothetical protein
MVGVVMVIHDMSRFLAKISGGPSISHHFYQILMRNESRPQQFVALIFELTYKQKKLFVCPYSSYSSF